MTNTVVKSAAAILAISVLGVAAFATTSFAAETGYTHTRTLKQGARGLQVEALQEALNACNEANLSADGVFGRGTRTAVMAFQKSIGLRADGVVGAMTGGELEDCASGETTSGEETSTTGGTTDGTLTGPEGNLTSVNKLSLYNNTKVNEGDKDIKVFAIEMTAKDGDQKIDGFNVAFKNTGTGSARFTRVASEVSIWLDGKEIGRKMASSFSDDASDVYSYRFSGMNGIVKKDMKAQLVVAVTPVSGFDSADIGADAWQVVAGTVVQDIDTVTVGNQWGGNTNFTSAMSSNGRFRDFGGLTAASVVDFQKVTGDATFKTVTSGNNPTAQTVQVSKTTDTSDKLLLAFESKAENADMILQRLPITMTNSGTLGQIVKTVKLYANGTMIASETPAASVIFGNATKMQYKIAKNSTVKFEVRADLNSAGQTFGNYANGTTLSASYATPTNYVEVDNANRDIVTTLTGSAVGETQTLRTTGAMVTMGTATYDVSTNQNAQTTRVVYNIPVTVKAFDETLYFKDIAAYAAATTVTDAVAFVLEDSRATGTQIVSATPLPNEALPLVAVADTGSVTSTLSSNATVQGGNFRIDAGTEKTLNVQVIVSGGTTANVNSMRVQLKEIRYSTDGSTFGTTQVVTPESSFETGFKQING